MRNAKNIKDPELINLLEELRSVPEHETDAAQAGRARFLREANILRAAQPPNPMARAAGWMIFIGRRNWAGLSLRQASIAMLMAVVVLLSAASLTVYAAQGSLPGETLYGVKLSFEDVFLSLSPSDSGDLNLHLDYAGRRVAEIAALNDSEHSQEIEQASARLGDHLQMASSILSQMKANNGNVPEETLQLFNELLSIYADITDDDDGAGSGEDESIESDAENNDDAGDDHDSQSPEGDEEDSPEQEDGDGEDSGEEGEGEENDETEDSSAADCEDPDQEENDNDEDDQSDEGDEDEDDKDC